MKFCHFGCNHSVLLYPNLYETAPSFYFAPPEYDFPQTTFVIPCTPSERTYRKRHVIAKHCWGDVIKHAWTCVYRAVA
jgi:hypothetical protein